MFKMISIDGPKAPRNSSLVFFGEAADAVQRLSGTALTRALTDKLQTSKHRPGACPALFERSLRLRLLAVPLCSVRTTLLLLRESLRLCAFALNPLYPWNKMTAALERFFQLHEHGVAIAIDPVKFNAKTQRRRDSQKREMMAEATSIWTEPEAPITDAPPLLQPWPVR